MATPVATSDGEYSALGRVFPDPLANCQRGGEGSPCSPYAQGNVPATQFIQYSEFVAALRFLNSKDEWRRYLEILPLDGKLGDGSGNGPSSDMAPGNNLSFMEFTPKPQFQSAGLPTSGVDRKKSDLIVARVTDESVPDARKKRYTLSLSIHGIERAGAEGGIRAIEDLVTAGTLGTANKRLLPAAAGPSPTFGETLRNVIIYFTLPNPDGWRRGSVSEGGFFYQRYNGNGVDLNRDWADVGFQHRYYSANSEPETQAFDSFYRAAESRGGEFDAGDDLHGQAEDDALSFTLLPHGRHRYEKDLRIRESAKKIHLATYELVKWSPIVQPNDAPRGGPVPCAPGAIGDNCAKIYGQTWGTVYDTINYTTAGTLGDWFDSSQGLGADGIDNEMSFSHLDKNIVFDPHTEQMHVDGNKALIYAHVATLLDPARGKFDAPGRKGYVPNERLKRGASSPPPPPEGTVPQTTHNTGPQPSGTVEFPVKEGPQPPGGDDGGKKIFNGGMRVEATALNAQGVGTGNITMRVQCMGCDKHRERSTDTNADWVTVGEDYNQSFLYAQSGITVAVNNPQAFFTDTDGKDKAVRWRVQLSPPSPASFQVHFSSGPAADDGNTGGDNPPRQLAYDVANTDFFRDLDRDTEEGLPGFEAVSARNVIDGKASLKGLDSLVLADNPLPGYNGPYGTGVSGDPPPDFDISWSPSVPGAGSHAPGTVNRIPFSVKPEQANAGAKIRIDWDLEDNDFDMFLYRNTEDGGQVLIGQSVSVQGTSNFEEIDVRQQLPAGDYEILVDNFASVDPRWTGRVTFKRVPGPEAGGPFSGQDRSAWFARIRDWVDAGGNLVLTDGALRALPELTGMPNGAIGPAQVYVGQVTFESEEGTSTKKDPLAQNPVTIDQQGARYNIGERRQTFEPTPLGFSIQPDTRSNADQAYSRQWDVDKKAFTAVGGRVAATSADTGARNAAPVYDRVTLGEIKLGKGQIRILGALLPQPSTEFNHPFGIEPYAITYTGYILARNLFEVPQILSSPTIGGRFLISGRAVKMRKNAAAVRVSCRTTLACVGTLKLQAKVKLPAKKGSRRRVNKTITLGKARFDIATKQRNKLLQVKIAKSARKYVLRARRVRVLATAPIRFTDGRRGIARKSFWLYRPTSRALRRR